MLSKSALYTLLWRWSTSSVCEVLLRLSRCWVFGLTRSTKFSKFVAVAETAKSRLYLTNIVIIVKLSRFLRHRANQCADICSVFILRTATVMFNKLERIHWRSSLNTCTLSIRSLLKLVHAAAVRVIYSTYCLDILAFTEHGSVGTEEKCRPKMHFSFVQNAIFRPKFKIFSSRLSLFSWILQAPIFLQAINHLFFCCVNLIDCHRLIVKVGASKKPKELHLSIRCLTST